MGKKLRPVEVHIASQRRPRQCENGEEMRTVEGYRNPNTEESDDGEHAARRQSSMNVNMQDLLSRFRQRTDHKLRKKVR